jgi:flavin reductase (DIM6/NTAB) family NADH-FMN oxidoreductase RutF
MKKSINPTNDFCPQTLFLYGTYKEDGTPNFGLFCWLSYYWDTDVGVMACIGGEKLTKDRIKAEKIFSANLVTEELLPVADYFGNTDGRSDAEKMNIAIEIEKGKVLNVPVVSKSPVVYELEVNKAIPLDDGEVFLCKIRNVLMDENLCDESVSVEERIKQIRPVNTTHSTYFSWDGNAIGVWGELAKQISIK